MTRQAQLKSPIRVDLTSDQDTVASSKAVLIEVFDQQAATKKSAKKEDNQVSSLADMFLKRKKANHQSKEICQDDFSQIQLRKFEV